MSLYARIVALLVAANTHKVFGVGVVTGIGATVMIVGAPFLDAAATAHLGKLAPVARWYVDCCANVAVGLLPPALLAAGFGRPPTIPANDADTHPSDLVH